MPKPSLRTRSKKRRRVTLPGGQSETRYKREKTGVSRCVRCGRTLSGLPRSIPSKLRRLPASQRRIERMYGGQLCHGCLQDLLRHAVRNI